MKTNMTIQSFIKLNMNAKIIKTQFCQKMKYDLKGHGRPNKALVAKFFLAHSFIKRFDKISMNANFTKMIFMFI